MTNCQSCGQPLGPEPVYDRAMGWLRTLCEDCLQDMGSLTTQDADQLLYEDDDDDID